MESNVVILLTACIDPKGMAFTVLQNSNERLEEYKYALRWYLDHTSYSILFVENTNFDITPFFKNDVDKGRLEVLTFDGNNYDKSLGKGFGEASIIDFGIENSKSINANSIVVKITGRFKAHGINRILKTSNLDNKTVYSDLVENQQTKEVLATSQFVIFPVKFFKEYFLPNKQKLNDSKGYFFEHLLRDAISSWKSDGYKFKELPYSAQLEGTSGSIGSIYKPSLKKEIGHFLERYICHPLGYFGPISLKKLFKQK